MRSYANVTATVALFLALGGSSYAAAELARNSVGTEQIRDGAVRTDDLHWSAVTSDKVRDQSLRSEDFKPGEIPPGPQGPPGPSGTVDTSQFFTKVESDARFLGIDARAADAERLDGMDSAAFTRGGGHIVNSAGTIAETPVNSQTIAELGGFRLTLVCRETAVDYVAIHSNTQMMVSSDDGSGNPTRDFFIDGLAGYFQTPTDRLVIQAFRRSDPSVAMSATVTVTDTGDACEYVVQATSSG